MRAACVIAMEKAQLSFDPMLEALRARATHIMKRLYPMVEDLVHKNLESTVTSRFTDVGLNSKSATAAAALDTHCEPFQHMMREIYERFVEQQMELCLRKCRDDLYGMTRFVTWDVDDQGGSSTLYRMLPTPKKMVEIYNVALEKRQKKDQGDDLGGGGSARRRLKSASGKRKRSAYAMDEDYRGYADDLDAEEADELYMRGSGDGLADPMASAAGSSPKSASDRILDEWAKANGGMGGAASAAAQKPMKKRKKKARSAAMMTAAAAEKKKGELALSTTGSGSAQDDPEVRDDDITSITH